MRDNKVHLGNNIINLYLQIWFLLSKRRKYEVIFLLLLMIIGGLSEIILLGSFIPLIVYICSFHIDKIKNIFN